MSKKERREEIDFLPRVKLCGRKNPLAWLQEPILEEIYVWKTKYSGIQTTCVILYLYVLSILTTLFHYITPEIVLSFLFLTNTHLYVIIVLA